MSKLETEAMLLERYKATMMLLIESVKALILINGGAAAGVVSAFGLLHSVIAPRWIGVSVMFFVLGLTFAGLCLITTFFNSNDTAVSRGGRFRTGEHHVIATMAWVYCLVSLSSFAIGAFVLALRLIQAA